MDCADKEEMKKLLQVSVCMAICSYAHMLMRVYSVYSKHT